MVKETKQLGLELGEDGAPVLGLYIQALVIVDNCVFYFCDVTRA